MNFMLQPWQLLLFVFAGWVNRQQQEVIEYQICDTTVSNILKAHGIEPAPTRKRTGSWEIFLKAHWDVIAAIDFTTVEVWTRSGLATFYLLFVMELKTRRAHFSGCTSIPHAA
jgi:hypothetical protein